MRTLANIVGLIVFLGTVPLLGILEIWHWSLTWGLLIGVPIWAAWGDEISDQTTRLWRRCRSYLTSLSRRRRSDPPSRPSSSAG